MARNIRSIAWNDWQPNEQPLTPDTIWRADDVEIRPTYRLYVAEYGEIIDGVTDCAFVGEYRTIEEAHAAVPADALWIGDRHQPLAYPSESRKVATFYRRYMATIAGKDSGSRSRLVGDIMHEFLPEKDTLAYPFLPTTEENRVWCETEGRRSIAQTPV